MQPRRRQSPEQDLTSQLLLSERHKCLFRKRLAGIRICRSKVRLLHRDHIDGNPIPILRHVRVGVLLHCSLVGDIIRSTNADTILSEELEGVGHVVIGVGPTARPEVDVLDSVGLVEDVGQVASIVQGAVEVFLAGIAG